MENKFIGLGDVLNKIVSRMGYTIKDETLLASLNGIELVKTDGLEILYKGYEEPKYPIPVVSATQVLNDISKREETFEKFWVLYNKKAGRDICFKKWCKLTQKDVDKIMETLPNYIKATPDIQFRKLPATYLNQRVWEDELYVQQKQETKSFNAFKF